MSLELKDVKEEDRGILGPCGILCLGCDYYIGEAVEAARKLYEIWDGWNIIDVGPVLGLEKKGIKFTLKTLKKFIKTNEQGNCPGCFKGSFSSQVCGIAKCIKTKGYWTCAECEDYDPESESPCPHIASKSPFIADKGQMMEVICKRYSRDTTQNLKRCREIGYKEFIKEAKKRVEQGWRTWQIIDKEMLFTNALKK